VDGCGRGCLIGNLGLEMASQHERFRARLEAIFCAWEARFAACLQAAQDAGELSAAADPRRLAAVLLSGWEGAILRAKVTKSTRPLADFITVFCDQVLRPSSQAPPPAPTLHPREDLP
jgi:TetR/AcrR family transcriptional repressor of nem operon